MLVEASGEFHPTEELLEEYVFGRVREPALASLEEHLLGCERCQAKLEEVDGYVRAWRSGTASFRPERSASLGRLLGRVFALPNLARSSALLACGLLLALISTTITVRSPRPVSEVHLTALRGGENGEFSSGPADSPLDLSVNASGLPPAASYRLELVDQSGRTLWSREPQNSGGRFSARVPQSPAAGIYWVRLYGTPDANFQEVLLREFGLRLR